MKFDVEFENMDTREKWTVEVDAADEETVAMIDKKFKDVAIGETFFEWGERDNAWVKHQKISENKAIRDDKDVEYVFDVEAICSFF